MLYRNAEHNEFTVDGVTVNVASMSEALSTIIAAVRERQSFLVCTLNLDHLAKFRTEPAFRESYARAQFVMADGFPIALLGRLVGARVARTTGSDLVDPLCAEAARNKLPIFLFGSTKQTLDECGRRLCLKYPHLEVAGQFAPSWNFDPYSTEADWAMDHIDASGARLCFVALGAPRQEIFAARCVDHVESVGFVCIGAALNFVAGTERRAPSALQKADLEWLWRLVHDPRRLTGRYVRCLTVFAQVMLREAPELVMSRLKQLNRAG